MRTLRFAPMALLAAASCLAPGTELVPSPADFAFVEIKLQG
jgi:hypothetical protein